MSLSSWLKIAAVFAGIGLCGLVNAQSMYRCGSVYQDQPCQGKDPGKRIGNTGSQESTGKPVSDSECAQRGADTLKIVWRKEAGASAQKQMEDIDAQRSSRESEQKRLIAEVYNKRGSALEVRAAIEADCMLEKERAAQAGAWAAAMPPLGQPKPAAPSGSSKADDKTADARRREEAAAQEAAGKKSRCEDLKGRLAGIRDDQRTGGDVERMEHLNQKSREVEKQLLDGRC